MATIENEHERVRILRGDIREEPVSGEGRAQVKTTRTAVGEQSTEQAVERKTGKSGARL